MSSSETAVVAPLPETAPPTWTTRRQTAPTGAPTRPEGAPIVHRARPVHSSAARGAGRPVPLRSVQPAPVARPARRPAPPVPPAPTVTVVPEHERRPISGLRDLARRVALWGAGPRGEYLSWSTPEPAPRAALRPRLRSFTRRVALWGAGPRGEHLAWGGPAPVPAPRQVDPPVVLRELPSTPTIRPAAPSPAVALFPAPTVRSPGTGPAVRQAARPARVTPAGTRWAPPPPGWPQPPVLSPPAARTPTAAPTPSEPGRTVPAARSPSAEARAGPARARGDPFPAPLPVLAAPG